MEVQSLFVEMGERRGSHNREKGSYGVFSPCRGPSAMKRTEGTVESDR